VVRVVKMPVSSPTCIAPRRELGILTWSPDVTQRDHATDLDVGGGLSSAPYRAEGGSYMSL